MLSFSLRRKSAPGSMNVREGSPSPFKQQGGMISSVSSKKSPSSLFSIATKDGSPRKKTGDEADILEQAQYPAYDPANPDHDPDVKYSSIRTPPKRPKHRTRSSSRSRSSSGRRSFLDTIASKMRAATEFFHKPTHSASPDSDDSEPLPAPRVVSPKKSVRFKSGTYASAELKSSPIDVPKKSASILPHLELPNAPLLNSFTARDDDPIPTGRPTDTPVLKAMVGDGYFSKPGPDIFSLVKAQLEENQTISGTDRGNRGQSKDPFEDITAITGDDVAAYLTPKSASTSASVVDSESSNERKLASVNSDSDKTRSTSDTLYEEEPQQKKTCDDECKTTDSQSDKDQSEANTPVLPKVNANHSPPSAQISHAFVQPAVPPFTGSRRENALSKPKPESIWTLESREQLKDDHGDHASESDDVGFPYSFANKSNRTQRRQPTHEDIRRQFRGPHPRSVPGLRNSSSPTDSDVEACPSIAPTAEGDGNGALELDSRILKVCPTTDPTKASILPSHRAGWSHDMIQPPLQTTPKESCVDQSVVVPDDAVSPLNLKANVTSTSPARTRRPFRFSNSTDKGTRVSPIGNTSFSWHAKKSAEDVSDSKEPRPLLKHSEKADEHPSETSKQTPSPVSIPLPLSIPPKKLPFRLRQPELRYTDQFGWSPFDESLFPGNLLINPTLHTLVLTSGGFAVFWEEVGLPKETAPSLQSPAVTEEQLQAILAYAKRFTDTSEAQISAIPISSNVMDERFSPWAASNVNRFEPLASHQEAYSGEVSTVDLSTADVCSDAGPHCCNKNCKWCLTRESYESSTDRSLESLSGYETDTDVLNSDLDNARSSGIHTPSRLPRLASNNKTPKRNDFAKHTLTRSKGKGFQGSEASNATVSTIGYMSEDEKFVKGII